MEQELLHQVVQRSVSYADQRIAERYGVQAHVRELNLFHLRPGARSRMVPNADGVQVLDGGPQWTMEDALQALRARPQDFSPNVLLRPIYQEVVLPNIAYIGGGGELAYWMQLRWTFQALQVPMPVVLLRTSAATITTKHVQQWRAMGLALADAFAPVDPLKTAVAERQASFSTDLADEAAGLEGLYAAILAKAHRADPTLRGAVEARRTQAQRGVERLQTAMLRAAKREQAVSMRRIDNVHEALFPGGGLQERRDNFLPHVAAEGLEAVDRWLDLLNPLEKTFAVVVEP
jgi:uncharacterized protein YllA (UPF0747 family)